MQNTYFGHLKLTNTKLFYFIYAEKPKILEISPNQTVKEGERLLITCRSSGDPQPEVIWVVNNLDPPARRVYSRQIQPLPLPALSPGAEMSKSTDDKLRLAGPVNLISRPFATVAAAGVQSHRMRRLRTASRFEERGQPDGLPPLPDILEALLPDNDLGETGFKGDSRSDLAELKAAASGGPARIRALADGGLLIESVQLVDEGAYVCIAKNKHGTEAQRGIFVRVLSRPQQHEAFILFLFLLWHCELMLCLMV
ncbi:unnamed protein product [Protopolystoma xenopodis]|uniref:Ig-like domain-containing protein n=1 Tax=Protopolystoma xenopodis TaxID=117903 RepID=A0A3S5CCW9_9PLAT|nr:unnamed protein product [Protopolystoma xenopodis]